MPELGLPHQNILSQNPIALESQSPIMRTIIRFSLPLLPLLSALGLLFPAQAHAEASQPGETIYRKHCIGCHTDGELSIAKFGNASDWATLIATGQTTLTARAWLGSGKMPPKGGAPRLTLGQFSDAVAFMARAAGADWQAPSRTQALLLTIRAETNRLASTQRNDAPEPIDQGLSGEAVYAKVCHLCHQSGVAGAPPLGNQARWEALIQEGQPLLTAQAWHGVRAMPPRGGTQDLSLEEFARAVAWMANAAGAKWPDPSTNPTLFKRIQKEIHKERPRKHTKVD